MKKSLLALAALTAFAGAASAQSSVTLFGVVDLSVNRVKNGSTSLTTMDSNQLNSNRIGFRGSEDLGGGMAASFWLEAGMGNDNGTVGGSNLAPAPTSGASVMFNRRSTLSLTGKFGEIRLGRDYTPTFWNTAVFDVYGANGWGEGANLMQQALGSGAQTVRVNNAVSYWLPSMGGLYGEIQFSAAEGAPTATYANKYRGGKLGYAAGPIDVVVGYGSINTITSDKFVVQNAGVSWTFGGGIKVQGLINKNSYGSKSVTAYELSTAIPIGAGLINASITHANRAASGLTGSGSANQVGLEYIYNLSKRTAVYAQTARISNSGKANYVFGGALSAADAAAGGFSATGFGVGVRHSF